MRENFSEVYELVAQWGRDRKIIPFGTSAGQAKKTMEEAGELFAACVAGDRAQVVDGVGDTLVTLIMVCELNGLDIVTCLRYAYAQIKERRGEMGSDGIFYRVGQTLPDGRVVE